MPSADWCAPIDAYCERTDVAFWSEPVNALSNLAFIAAAALAYRLWRRTDRGDWAALYFVGLTAIVGVGSFLFHTFANRWSLLADVLPITVFIYSYFALAMVRYLGCGPVSALLLTLGFGAFNSGFVILWKAVFGRSGVDWTNGSVGYFPAAIALLSVGGLALRRAWARGRGASGQPSVEGRNAASRAVIQAERAGLALLVSAAIFSVSLFFRSIDLAVCSWWAIGTHFLWHILNGAVLFTLVRAAIRHGPGGAIMQR
jgi:hypothetical protein